MTRSLLGDAELRYRIVAGLVLAESALLVSIHLAAALQLFGGTERMAFWHVAATLALLLAGAAALYVRRPKEPSRQTAPAGEAIPAYLWISGVIICGAYLVGAVNAFRSYIVDWDAVSYHLLLPHHLVLDGSFAISPATNWRFGMPANGETAMYVFFAGGLDRWAFLVQWPPLVCLLVSVYALALSVSKSRQAGLCCVAVAATLPIVFNQTFNGYIDLFAASFMMAALALSETALRRSAGPEPYRGLFWVTGLACGIAVGSKVLYVAFVGPLVLVVAAGLMWRLERRVAGGLAVLCALLAGVLLTSSFWYLRGWLLAGNPVFPMRVAIGDWVIFPGIAASSINSPDWAIGRWVNTQAEWLTWIWREYRAKPSMTTYSIDTGVGGLFAAFVPVGAAFFLWTASRPWADRRMWSWTGGVLYCGLVWWFPLHQTLRFGLIFMVMLVLMAAPLFAVLSEKRNLAFWALFCLGTTITSAILALEPAAFIAARYLADVDTRAEVYRYPTYVDDLPAGSTVLNLVAPNNFAMTGTRLSNRVVGFFEGRRTLTSEVLQTRGIDYIVGLDKDVASVEGLAGVQLVHSELLHDPIGLTDTPWRIWKVDRADGVAPSDDGL
ncbi:MAG: hypothetical protein O3A53_16510 [Acidobacteria bacterium]|nr:hypothetical protein [Acidobacteriota bacterium]MDA1236386.1 hypothetical protein [Acidobacteriota bacterium]